MNDLLSIGLGGCGNKLLNAFMQLDSTKDGIFINSNINEMKSLSECNNDNRLAIVITFVVLIAMSEYPFILLYSFLNSSSVRTFVLGSNNI